MTQLERHSVDGRMVLDAAIPAPSGRGSVTHGGLADRGWARREGHGTRYYRRRFTDAAEAGAVIVAAYAVIYG